MPDYGLSYAVSKTSYGGWSFRVVTSESDIVDGETFYATYSAIPQDVQDWIAANSPE